MRDCAAVELSVAKRPRPKGSCSNKFSDFYLVECVLCAIYVVNFALLKM